jgi:hypothetical protein
VMAGRYSISLHGPRDSAGHRPRTALLGLLAARLLPLAGRAAQFHAAGVARQYFRGALPPICALVARQRSCCVCSPDTR